jgi:predicted methyltransferase
MKRSVLLACLLWATPGTADSIPDHIARAVNHPDRSQADRQRDLTSRPADVLTFLRIEPGMTVLDMLAGDGYYAEIAARAVGTAGHVYLHNNQAYRGLMIRRPRRLVAPGLETLEVYLREIADINLPSASLDAVLLVKVYHDLYYVNNGWNVPPGPFFDTIHRLLKPDGIIGVVDHAAPPGTGSAYAQTLHRIDPEFARVDIEARGFRLEAESDVLANPHDDLTRSAFASGIRGQTQRFVHRYRKVPRE